MLSPVFRETFQRTEGCSPEWNIGVGGILKNTLRLSSTRATALPANRHHFLMRKQGSACVDILAEDSPVAVAQAIVDYRADEPAHGYSCRTCRSGSVPHDATAQRWPAPQHSQPCVLLLPRLGSRTDVGVAHGLSLPVMSGLDDAEPITAKHPAASGRLRLRPAGGPLTGRLIGKSFRGTGSLCGFGNDGDGD